MSFHNKSVHIKTNATILYVEDEIELAENVILLFTMNGIHVIHADDAVTAITKSLNQKFDLMLFDIHLQKGTGDYVIEKIRNNHNNPNMQTPCVVISSHLDNPLIHRLKDHIQGAVVKPFDIEVLMNRVTEFLGK